MSCTMLLRIFKLPTNFFASLPDNATLTCRANNFVKKYAEIMPEVGGMKLIFIAAGEGNVFVPMGKFLSWEGLGVGKRKPAIYTTCQYNCNI